MEKTFPKQKRDWFKISFFSTLLLLLVLFLILVGLQITKNLNPISPKPIAIQPTIIPTAVVTPTTNPDLKTYTDSKFGFSFEYPYKKGYIYPMKKRDEFLVGTLSFLFTHNDDIPRYQSSEVTISVFVKNGLTLENWLKRHSTVELYGIDEAKEFSEYSELGKTRVAGLPAIRFQYKALNWVGYRVAVEKGDYVYTISYVNVDDDISAEYQQILSTFKFIDTASDNSLLDKLVSKKWFWVKTQINDGTLVTPKKAGDFSLTFKKDGKLLIDTDCNDMSTSYSTKNSSLDISDKIMSTKMYCNGSLENIFSKDLVETAIFSISDSGKLILDLKYDTGSIIFE